MCRVIFFTPNHYVKAANGLIGKIINLFVYSSVCYATLSSITTPPNIVYGLMHFKNVKHAHIQKAIYPLNTLSKPLPVANTPSDMWVLNTLF